MQIFYDFKSTLDREFIDRKIERLILIITKYIALIFLHLDAYLVINYSRGIFYRQEILSSK